MDFDDDKDNLNEKLLPRDKRKSEEFEPEFQSWRSVDEEEDKKADAKTEANPKSSINASDLPRKQEGKGLEESKGKMIRLEGEHSEQVEDEDSRKPPSMNFGPKKKHKAKTIWREILDFLFFCYEFLMISAVIVTGSFLPCIPCSIYVFLSISYLGISIIVQDNKTSLTLWTVLMGVQLSVSIVFLIFKIVFSILIKERVVVYNKNLYLGLGIAIQPDDLDGWDVVRTFISDVCSLIVSLALFIGWIIRSKKKISEFDESKIETLKVTGARSPSFWICVCLLLITLAGIISPSLIALSFSSKSTIYSNLL